METVSTLEVFRFYKNYAKRYTWTFWISLFAGVAAVILSEIVSPIALKQFVDVLSHLNSAREQLSLVEWHELVGSFLLMFGTMIGYWFFYRAQAYPATFHQIRVMQDVDTESMARVTGHSFEFFSNNFIGSLTRKIRRLSNSYESLHDALSWHVMPFFMGVVGISIVLIYRFQWFGFAIVGWCMCMGLVASYFAKEKMSNDEKTSAMDSKHSGLLADILTNWLTIKLFTSAKREHAGYTEMTRDLYKLERRGWLLNQMSDTTTYAMQVAGEMVLIWVLLRMWTKNEVTIGDFFLLQSYGRTIGSYFQSFGRMTKQITRALADAKEGIAILQTPYDIEDRVRAPALRVSRGEINFDHVSFSYNQLNVINELNLKIASKEKVAFVGPSGAGKTTLVKLLFRFYEATNGHIRIDGKDIRVASQVSLRSVIALVPQEPVLFHRSLRENIRYGMPAATDRQVIEAAKKARCHEFISALPDGYDTFVGERGIKLSGGERQRVAIARAILKNAPILVLDEATSSLDSESEQAIQVALKNLMKGKTVIVIAHRLSTIMEMDRIIVLEGGRISDTGTHDELIAREGTYKKLWSIQAGGFIGEE